MEHGRYTAEVGCKLYTRYNGKKYHIYYDHGKGETRTQNTCKPTPYFGDFKDYSKETTLSNVDIVVLDEKKDKVLLLVEIEESGNNPKKVLGDIGAILISDGLMILDNKKREFHSYCSKVKYILGIKTRTEAQNKKITGICNRINPMQDKLELIPICKCTSLPELETDVYARIVSILDDFK